MSQEIGWQNPISTHHLELIIHCPKFTFRAITEYDNVVLQSYHYCPGIPYFNWSGSTSRELA